MRLKPKQKPKQHLSPTLKSWIPILQGSNSDLEEILEDFTAQNPLVEIQSNIAQNITSANIKLKKAFNSNAPKRFRSDVIESLSIYENSLYEVLEAQIVPPLFPTQISQQIALLIIENINTDGYFDGSENEIAKICGTERQIVSNIRQRFSKIDPPGIAALNPIESMIFQLDDFDLDDDFYDLCFNIINDLENHKRFSSEIHYQRAMKIISKLKIPPALEYFPKEIQIIPDIFILRNSEGGIGVHLNDEAYPNIIINKHALEANNSTIKEKIKEARDLVDALNMRKATIEKIGLTILDYQYDFFDGGEIKPMKLKDIANDLGHSPSTISRAVSNKYLECDRGIYPLKSFFSTAINDETSNSSIKDFINECIKCEDKNNPLSDLKILDLIESKFGVKMVRRTITKYRKQLNIASSSERKKLYEVKL